MPGDAKRATKLDRLVAAYEQIGQELAGIPDQTVERLRNNCLEVRSFVADARSRDPSLRPSQIAAGLEQGLRETLMMLASADKKWRARVVEIYRSTVASQYPDFFAKDAEKFAKIRARGRIRTEAEFYLVRHEIDEAEGAKNQELLGELYGLVDEYEARGG
jgi:type VI protein secretion system component VasK